jgi:predicted helicase
MACGTGKTLVALWAAERIGAQRILVLVPSLALVRQFLHEWLREHGWDKLAFLCVCSDPTVAREPDEIVLTSSDLDFPVATDAALVRRFLDRPFDGVKVVFSTYQSANVVANGLDDPFDVGIFDEAHRTAGREGTNFSLALKDSNLPISKRLFFTATPRHYDIRKRDNEGDARLVYSMDVSETYGPIAYRLSFGEAARRKLICGYKVLVCVADSRIRCRRA